MYCIFRERTYYYNNCHISRLIKEDRAGNRSPIFGADSNAVIVLDRGRFSVETIGGEILFYSNGDYNEALECTLSADNAAKITVISDGHTYTRAEYEQELEQAEQDGDI